MGATKWRRIGRPSYLGLTQFTQYKLVTDVSESFSTGQKVQRLAEQAKLSKADILGRLKHALNKPIRKAS